MEVRMQPRTEGSQRCLSFDLDVSPSANITQYSDFTGNAVHHFDIAGSHTEVKVTAQSTVQVQKLATPQPSEAGDWADLDALTAADDYWEMMLPSHFAHSSAAVEPLAKELACERRFCSHHDCADPAAARSVPLREWLPVSSRDRRRAPRSVP
jgi:transglutaminase-like putative cysteine protease